MDHMIVVLFENRSLDNVLGHLYGPDDDKTFEGVVGKDLSNPIPTWAEHGAARRSTSETIMLESFAGGRTCEDPVLHHPLP
jgi:phospholipase C